MAGHHALLRIIWCSYRRLLPLSTREWKTRDLHVPETVGRLSSNSHLSLNYPFQKCNTAPMWDCHPSQLECQIPISKCPRHERCTHVWFDVKVLNHVVFISETKGFTHLAIIVFCTSSCDNNKIAIYKTFSLCIVRLIRRTTIASAKTPKNARLTTYGFLRCAVDGTE